jgi:uncharacterized Zn finger protein (UPF0148 family)
MAQAIQTNAGVTNFGLMKVRNNDAIAAEAEAKQQATRPQQIVSGLTGYINSCWSAAKIAKQPIEQQMLANMRQRNGVYDAGKEAAIRAQGGSEIYILLTATKCRAAEAWIQDILSPVSDRPWTIEPTPEAELTGEKQEALEQEAREVFQEVMQQAQQMQQSGMVPLTQLREEIKEYVNGRREELLSEIKKEAKLRSDRMTSKMDDQLTEGGWHDSFWAIISDLVTLKGGVLKGPVIRRRKVKKWTNVDGRWVIQAPYELVAEFDRVSPLDLYPAPDSRGVDDGYLFERHNLTRTDLLSMIGVPGYNEANIREAIQLYGTGGHREYLSPDSERAAMEFGTANSIVSGDKIEALEFWGSVQGKHLIEWGMGAENIDPELDYEVNVWQVGSVTIRAMLNPDQLGRKPYSVDSFDRVPGSFWGRGIPELISDLQDICNAIARSIINNAALASGPQVEVNTDRIKGDSTEIHPWKIWESTNQQMLDSPAVRFTQPQIVTSALMQVYEFFSTLADDQSGVPRWAYGQSQQGGAGSTSSGLSMLMTSASRGIKMVIGHVDCMTEKAIERLYDYNMIYDPVEDIKGDCNIVARGSSSLIAKEQQQQKLNEFLQATNNPIDIQIVGLANRSKMLMQHAKELGIKLVDDDDLQKQIAEFAQQVRAQAQQQMAAQSQGTQDSPAIGRAPVAKPQQLDNAGNPAGGTETNTFQNAPGVTP